MAKRRPGVIRDAIVSYLSEVERDASVGEITQAVEAELGPDRRAVIGPIVPAARG